MVTTTRKLMGPAIFTWLILSIIIIFYFFSFQTLMLYPRRLGGDEGPIANSFENYNRNGSWNISFYRFAPLNGQYHFGRFYLIILSYMDRFLNNSPLAGRLLSFFSALGVSVIFYLVMRRLVENVNLSLFLTLSLATSGFFVSPSHFARFEMFVSFWFMLSVLFLIIAYKTKKNKYLLLSGLCAAIIIEIHTIAIVIIPSIILGYILSFRDRTKRKIVNAIFYFIFPAIFMSVFWFLNRYFSNPSFLKELVYLKGLMAAQPYLQRLSVFVAHSLGYRNFENLPDIIFIICSLLTGLFLIKKCKKERRIPFLIYISFVLVFLLVARFNSHYLVYFLVLGFIVAGIILKEVNRLVAKKVLLILLICFSFFNLLKYTKYFAGAVRRKGNFYNYGKNLKAKIPEEATVLVYHNLAYFFGDRFISNRDLEFAIDFGKMSINEYIDIYKIDYLVHDHYFNYLLRVNKVNKADFRRYIKNNLELIAEIESPYFGVYEEKGRKLMTRVYKVKKQIKPMKRWMF